jgi:hypothetical protein
VFLKDNEEEKTVHLYTHRAKGYANEKESDILLEKRGLTITGVPPIVTEAEDNGDFEEILLPKRRANLLHKGKVKKR